MKLTHPKTARTLVAALAAIVAFGAAGCGASDSAYVSEPIEPATSWSPDYSEGLAGNDHMAEMAAAEDAAAMRDLVGSEVVVQPQVIVTGSAALRVKKVDEAIEDLRAWTESAGGRVDTVETSGVGEYAWGSLTIRVPADKYEDLVAHLAEVGTTTSLTTNREDVGRQVADIEARVAALETSIDRLKALMEQATTTAELLEAERELTYRQAELDSLNSQRAYLADQVQMSTLNVSLTTEVSPSDPDRNVFQRSWESFLDGLAGIFEIVVYLAPWLVLIAVLVSPLVWWVRKRRARRRKARQQVQAGGAASTGAEDSGEESGSTARK